MMGVNEDVNDVDDGTGDNQWMTMWALLAIVMVVGADMIVEMGVYLGQGEAMENKTLNGMLLS